MLLIIVGGIIGFATIFGCVGDVGEADKLIVFFADVLERRKSIRRY